jgi:hypothetical protein
MLYLLTIYADESHYASMGPEELGGVMEAHGRFGAAAGEAGVLRGGNGLQPTSTATTVRLRDGETMLTDGPFAETREQLGGFYMIDVDDLDEAVRWAAQVPEAGIGSIEVRPVMVFDEPDAGGAAAGDRQAAQG